jgi:hypothetical protein
MQVKTAEFRPGRRPSRSSETITSEVSLMASEVFDMADRLTLDQAML